MELRKRGASRVHRASALDERKNAHGGFPFIDKFFVELPVFGRDARILCGGHSFFVEVNHHAEEAVAALFVSVGWDDFLDQVHSGFFQDTSRLTLFVANNDAGFRVLRFRGDFRETEGVGIGNTVVSGGVLEPDGIVGRDGVEIRGGDVAAFLEFGFVPAGAADPLAWFQSGGFLADEFEDVLDAGDFAESDFIEYGGFVEVAVSVDKAGCDGEAVKIDGLRGFRREFANLVVRTDGGDFAVVDGDGLDDGVAGVNGEDAAVEEDEVGIRRLAEARRRAPETNSQEKQGENIQAQTDHSRRLSIEDRLAGKSLY